MFNITTTEIAKNTVYQLIGKLITMSVTVLLTLLITRNYGAGGYGEFSLMQSFPALFFIIVDFGLNAISIREVSKEERNVFDYFINVLFFRVLFSVLFIVLLSIVIQFFPYSASLKFGIRLSLLLILTQSLYASTNIIFQYKLRYDLSAIGLISGYVLVLLLSFVLVMRNASIVWVNFTYVFGGLVTFIVNFVLITRLGIKRNFKIDIGLIKSLLLEALPLGVMFVFSQVNFKEDALLLSILKIPDWVKLTSAQVVGVYSLPYKVFEVTLVLPTFFMNATFPVLMRHMRQGEAELKDTFKKIALFLLAVGILVGVLGISFAPQIINLLGGENFSRSISVLRILIGGVFIFYLTQPLSWLIIALGKQIYLPYIYFFSVLLNLTFNLIFIPKYSFYAAAFITVTSEFFILLLLSFFAVRAWRQKYAS